jgi:predicted acyltransferase
MIIVNSPGSGATPFAPLMHASWDGFTATDLIFPSFLFAVGNSMSFSQEKYKGLTEKDIWLKILQRTFLIFLIGYLIYWFPFFKISDDGSFASFPISETRIMGVLQRIALCYLFASALIRYFSTKTILIICLSILIGYWMILLLFGNPHDPYSITGNACLYLDKLLFNEKHLYREGGIAFDPEGVLGTLPALTNVLIGYISGKFIRENGKGYQTVARLMIAGTLLIFAALCWNMVFPINKNLWTSPFVLITTGLDLVIIGILLYVTETRERVPGKWTGFFVAFGKNPLFIYVTSVLIRIILNRVRVNTHTTCYEWLNVTIFQHIAPGPVGSLLFALCFVIFSWVIVWFMDKRKIYIRL